MKTLSQILPLQNLDRPGVSVVIVCYNSVQRLRATLKHLAVQRDVTFPWEVLIVDNNSSDGTAVAATKIWSDVGSPTDLVVVHEPTAGTMHARKKGMLSSRYRYILFCDDDNWLCDRYIREAFETIRKDASIAAVGGMGLLSFENESAVPPWILKFQHNYAGGAQGTKDGDTTEDKRCLYTAGTIIDKVWLDKLYNGFGFKSSLTGRSGKSLIAGEDTELTYALILVGARLYFNSQLRFFHFMPAKRTSWSYLRRLNEAMGRAEFLLYPYTEAFLESGRNLSLMRIVCVRFYFLIKSYIKAVVCAFDTGSPEVLRYDRAKGEVVAALFDLKKMESNRAWVESAAKRVRRNRTLVESN